MDLDGGDSVDTNDVVGVSGKEGGSIGGPGQAGAGGHASDLGLFRSECLNDDLRFEVPDLDRVFGGGTQPVSVGAEDESVDDGSGIEAVESLALVEVPKHGGVVLTSGGGEGTVGTDADGVEVSGVSDEVVSELAVGEVPDLDELVPSAANNEGYGLNGGESNTRDPVGVSLGIGIVSGDGVLALSERVPETDGSITSSCYWNGTRREKMGTNCC